MQAAIISIGDELVLGQTVDTNSAWLSAELAAMGVFTRFHHTLSDDRADTAAAILQASAMAPIVLVSGGLGPTEDDLTRQGLADAMGVGLFEDAESVRALEAFFAARGRKPAANNMLQALCPIGARMIPNTCGTAPGVEARVGQAKVICMPGVPSEMKEMFRLSARPAIERIIAADLAQQTASAGNGAYSATAPARRLFILSEKINTFGLGESNVGERLGTLMARDRNPRVGTTVAGGIVSVRVRSEGADEDVTKAALADTVAQVERALGPIVFGRGDASLQEALLPLLRQHGLSLATAESCTGGLLGGMITEVPGSSDVYRGGWVTYANAMKSSQLGVPPALIEAHGAVSPEVAIAMAQGALERAGADLAVAITGVAGPGGGSDEKPVGTVWIALARRGQEPQSLLYRLPGERPAVRDRAAKCALQMLRMHLMGVPLETIAWGRAK